MFGLFTFLPIGINFWYAFTGSSNLMPEERPWVGLGNMRALLACGDYLDPSTCQRDLFWHGIHNTLAFVAIQVSLMVVFAMITALALTGRSSGAASSGPRSSTRCCCRRWWWR